MDLEVAGQAAADAGQHAIGAAALQPLHVRDLCGVFAHGPRIAGRAPHGYPE
jgi:hypothetical protein